MSENGKNVCIVSDKVLKPNQRYSCFCYRGVQKPENNQSFSLTITWGSILSPFCKTSVMSSGCSRNMWQRVSSLGTKYLTAAIIQAGDRSVAAPMDVWSSDTHPNTALVSTCGKSQDYYKNRVHWFHCVTSHCPYPKLVLWLDLQWKQQKVL